MSFMEPIYEMLEKDRGKVIYFDFWVTHDSAPTPYQFHLGCEKHKVAKRNNNPVFVCAPGG